MEKGETSPPPPNRDDGVDDSIRKYGLKEEFPRKGEYRKLPNDFHNARMKDHIRHCHHRQCKFVWRGPWGCFIGGARGKDYFDLTECKEGRRLNELIGWDYSNPRA